MANYAGLIWMEYPALRIDYAMDLPDTVFVITYFDRVCLYRLPHYNFFDIKTEKTVD